MSDAPRKPPRLSSDPESAGPPEPAEAPPREFQFKPTEFERANRPGEAPIDVAQLYRAANAPAPAPAAAAKAENEVHAILRANLAADEAKGLNQVVPKIRRSRRKRDYWLLLISWNLLMGAIAIESHQHYITLVLCLSAAVFVSVALTWIMWAILDDY